MNRTKFIEVYATPLGTTRMQPEHQGSYTVVAGGRVEYACGDCWSLREHGAGDFCSEQCAHDHYRPQE
jgi:hypothetical protein